MPPLGLSLMNVGSLGLSVVNPLRLHWDTLRTQFKRTDRKLPRSTLR